MVLDILLAKNCICLRETCKLVCGSVARRYQRVCLNES